MAQQRQLALPTYLVAATLILFPLYDAVTTLLPLTSANLHNVGWRFSHFGSLSNVVVIPLLGVLVAFVASNAFDHARFQKVLGIVMLVGGIITFGLLGLFMLDALQARALPVFAKPTQQLAFKVATLTAIVKWLMSIATSLAFWLASFRAPSTRRSAAATTSPLIMGR